MQETSDLSIAQWLILSCTQPKINCGENLRPYGASRGINMSYVKYGRSAVMQVII